MTQEEREAFEAQNRYKSAGSAGGLTPDQIRQMEDPTAEAKEYIDKLREYGQQAQEAVQTAFPGFEEQAQEPAPLDAETVKINTGRVSFKIDYLKSPEDALIAWSAPAELLDHYHTKHFNDLVKIAAEQLGADPEQIRDKDRRTPEQQLKLTEIAAVNQLARLDAFFASRYYNALKVLDTAVKGSYIYHPAEQNISAANWEAERKITAEEDQEASAESADFIPLKALAATYFFAIHEDFWPTEAGRLTEGQQEELKEIFYKLDAFYCNYEKIKRREITSEELASVYSLFIDAQHPAKKPEPKEPGRKSKFAEAEESGAIMGIDRLLLPSDPVFQFAFTTSTKANSGFYRKDSETGAVQLALDVNPAFIRALGSAVYNDIINGKHGDTSIYFPTFARSLGIDFNRKELEATRAGEREAFVNKMLASWDSLWGPLPGDSTEYKLMAMHTYNPETEIVTFQSPYFLQLLDRLLAKEEAELASGKHYYNWKCDLLHATAAGDRNPAAVEMAARILVGVQQRGLTPDAKLKQNKGKAFIDESEVTYSISCAGLINDCPLIREKLKKLPDANRKTKLLKRAFAAMYKVLRAKSDLFSYYKDLAITEVIPTAKSLDAFITISHHGSNPAYQKPFIHLQEEPEPEAET